MQPRRAVEMYLSGATFAQMTAAAMQPVWADPELYIYPMLSLDLRFTYTLVGNTLVATQTNAGTLPATWGRSFARIAHAFRVAVNWPAGKPFKWAPVIVGPDNGAPVFVSRHPSDQAAGAAMIGNVFTDNARAGASAFFDAAGVTAAAELAALGVPAPSRVLFNIETTGDIGSGFNGGANAWTASLADARAASNAIAGTGHTLADFSADNTRDLGGVNPITFNAGINGFPGYHPVNDSYVARMRAAIYAAQSWVIGSAMAPALRSAFGSQCPIAADWNHFTGSRRVPVLTRPGIFDYFALEDAGRAYVAGLDTLTPAFYGLPAPYHLPWREPPPGESSNWEPAPANPGWEVRPRWLAYFGLVSTGAARTDEYALSRRYLAAVVEQVARATGREVMPSLSQTYVGRVVAGSPPSWTDTGSRALRASQYMAQLLPALDEVRGSIQAVYQFEERLDSALDRSNIIAIARRLNA